MADNTDAKYRDIRNVERYTATNRAVLNPFYRNDSHLEATDAAVIYELTPFSLRLSIPGLCWDRSGVDAFGIADPTSPFISSPNMNYIPDVTAMSMDVIARMDGRYFASDFTLMPQVYFEETAYLPFVLRKPPPEELATHKFRRVWHDLTREDFVLEEGSILEDVGRITPFLSDRFTFLRKGIQEKLKALQLSGEYTSAELNNFEVCVRGAHLMSISLICAPQPWAQTLINVTTFQRYWHESYACYRYLTFWKKRPINPDRSPHPVDTTIMGSITAEVQVAVELHAMGVPVWLIRPPSVIPRDMTINVTVYPTLPDGIIRQILPGSKVVHSGPASPVHNRACQSYRMTNIAMGHSAYIVDGRLGSIAVPVPTGPSQPAYVSITPAHSSLFIRYGDAEPMTTQAGQNNAPPTSANAALPQNTPPMISAQAPASPLIAPSSSSSSSRREIGGSSAAATPVSAQKTRSYEKEKFKEPSSAYMPSTLACWVLALEGVNHETSERVKHDDYDLLRGYVVFDPFVLATGNIAQNRFWIYLVAWLSVRCSWISFVTNSFRSGGSLPLPQEWKSFLTETIGRKMGLFDIKEFRNIANSFRDLYILAKDARGPSPAITTKTKVTSEGMAARRGRRHANMLENVDIKFGIDIGRITQPISIYWKGRLLASKQEILSGRLDVSRREMREILWDLFEQNFRMEFLSLDRCVRSRNGLSDEEKHALDSQVSACFPHAVLVNLNFPNSDEGLAALDWKDRAEYVEAFRKVLAEWGGPEAEELKQMQATVPFGEGRFDTDEDKVVEVERITHGFYCQTFFNYFGRAPTIPHSVPL